MLLVHRHDADFLCQRFVDVQKTLDRLESSFKLLREGTRSYLAVI